jgi:peptidyl-prolyl cis-trans isomerase SurA
MEIITLGRKYSFFFVEFLCFAGVVFITILFCGAALAEETVLVDRIVAVVNDELITLYELNQKFEPYLKNIKSLGYSAEKERKMLFKLRSDLLDQVIDATLADQEIKKNKLVVTDAEVDSTLERLKVARSMTDEDLRAGLAQQGITMEEYHKEIKEQLLRSKLINIEVKSKIVITKESVQAYYDAHRENYAGQKKYHLWNIYMSVSSQAGESERRAALKKMETVLSQLKQDASFEALAKSDAIASLEAKGGDLGLFLIKELSAQFQKVVENMKAGEFSSILESDSGYQILYVEKIIEAPSKSFETVQEEIQEILYKELVDNKYQEWLEALRKRSHIKIIN